MNKEPILKEGEFELVYDDAYVRITRIVVPGGWIYYGSGQDEPLTSCFVPRS